jgi:hypothetical protein
MAGGIDWFRWHHGSVTDPKFQLVARKSGATLPEVLAVWVFVLESASASEKRGHFGEIDCEAIDCLFGMDEGKTSSILEQMTTRGLIDGGCVSSWEKRQPKRERENDSSTDRVRAFREKQRHETQVTPGEAPCNVKKRQETPRGEESREEINTPQPPKGIEARFERFWKSYPRKVGKDAARKKFEQRKPDDVLLDDMLQAIADQAMSEQWLRDGGQYIPHPATWLSQGRWQDGKTENPTNSIGVSYV